MSRQASIPTTTRPQAPVAAPYGRYLGRHPSCDPFIGPVAKITAASVALIYFLSVLLWVARMPF